MNSLSWPHAPPHDCFAPGAYIVTASTYRKQHHLSSRKRLRFFCDLFFQGAEKHGWKLQAWAVLSNHYHFVALSPAEGKQSLVTWLTDLHRDTAVFLNSLDDTPGRKVWYNYFDTPLTYQKSYLARLNYVQNNPVKHGLVAKATDYDWCSASWFARNAPSAFQKTVSSFKTDSLKIYDDFFRGIEHRHQSNETPLLPTLPLTRTHLSGPPPEETPVYKRQFGLWAPQKYFVKTVFDALPRKHPFEEKYNQVAEIDFESCSQVLNRHVVRSELENGW